MQVIMQDSYTSEEPQAVNFYGLRHSVRIVA